MPQPTVQPTIPDTRFVKVDVDTDGLIVIVRPLDDEALGLFQEILDGDPTMHIWNSKGCNTKSLDSDELMNILFACGGTRYQHHRGNGTSFEYDGAIYIGLDVTESANGNAGPEKFRLYNYVSGGVIVDPSSTAERMILKASQTCSSCEVLLGTFAEKDRGTCNSCDGSPS